MIELELDRDRDRDRGGDGDDHDHDHDHDRDHGDDSLGGLSAGSFLRRVAFAPPAEPPRTERDCAGQTHGRFQIEGVLGRGGMGVVYRALDPTLRRKVALKLLCAGAVEGPERRRRLLREARAAAAVSHPNIVTVFEAGEVDGDLFIAMELVEGPDARAWLAARLRSRREILAVFAMAGRGLAAAHRAGLIHRDFKPENVLIDAAGRARVADFGLALSAAHDPDAASSLPAIRTDPARLDPQPSLPPSVPGAVAGTPGYIAPECLAGREADARADQFAFCVALYEALEGQRPTEARPLRPRRTPRWLRGILARGLAPCPADRFPSMDALLARMERARSRRRRAAIALVVTAAALAAWGSWPDRSTPRDDAAAAEIPASWIEAREPIREPFARAGFPYAADAGDRVELGLDAWTERWFQARCTATAWPGCDAIACLERQQQALGAVLDLLRRADAQVVARAAALVNGLGDPARCLEVRPRRRRRAASSVRRRRRPPRPPPTTPPDRAGGSPRRAR